ncbi:alpha/beta hydrolase [Nonomuraea sp. KC401]|uniref:alpha/beta hydrolase n=1 Tax=unclassified Nonomuraea TaxID=2593643 RepID=UPI0010FD23EB|nr:MULTISPECIES: alpha/beta hydrolase [unclassified Nonomuraea]NBE99528.1 alpha/beta fold hydrolase [Nonomuraea sp. K271]TLF49185.1 alpha/beta hydrolase [Nonomuraea sp. KC401]
MKKPIATFLLGAAVLTACGSTGEPAPAAKDAAKDTDTGSVAWARCTDLVGPDGKPVTPAAGTECGTIQVPLDHADPAGEKIDLALIRMKATGDRLGSLVFNFGGPGASGVDTLAMAGRAFAGLNQRYDLVSFDPRGVERSAGVKCGGQVDKLLSAEAEADADQAAKEFAQACRQDSGKILPHVGTVNAAKDLDLIRGAVGDKQLNYLGFSYGTHLGAVYATHFPKNVGRFVLDGAFDPTVTFDERAVIQATGFDQAFDAFAKDCVAQSCELGADPAAVEKTVEDLLDKLKKEPLKVGDRELTYSMAQLAVITPLYAKATWPMLEQAAAAALKGNGTALLALADSYTGRKADGTYSTVMTSLQAINCVDNADRPTAAETARTNAKIKKIFPILSVEGSGESCAHWPVPGNDEAKRIDATGSAPIVVVGTKGDPATPYRWAPALTEQLKTGVLLTYEGEGHGAYLSGNGCVMKTVDAYLVEGKVPDDGSTCPA